MKRLVKDLIRQKGLNNFTSVSPDASIFEALNAIEAERASALLVIEDGKLRGIFSERDFAKASIWNGIHLFAPVSEVMTKRVYYVNPAFNLEECLQVMTKVQVRHLPVLENGAPIALLSMSHIMEVLVQDKEAQIQELTTYIAGGHPVSILAEQLQLTEVPIFSTKQTTEAI